MARSGVPGGRLGAAWLNLSLPRKGLIVAAIPALTILVATVPVVLNDISRGRTNDAIRRTQQARENAGTILRQMMQAENHMLGFILTSDSTLETAFAASTAAAARVLAATDSLSTDATTRPLFLAVRTRADAMLAEMAHEVDLARASRQPPSATRSLQLLAQERRTTEELERAVTALIMAEDSVLAVRVAQLGEARRRRIYLAALVLLVGVLGAGASAVLFMYGVARRVELMQAQATTIPSPPLRRSETPSRRTDVGRDAIGKLAVAIQESRQETARTADRLRMAVRAAHIEVIEFHPETDHLAVVGSGNVFRRMGYSSDAIPTSVSGFLELVHPDDVDRVAAALRNVTPGWEYVIEFRLDAAGLDWRWMELRGAAPPPLPQTADPDAVTLVPGVTDPNAPPRAAVGVLLDVTERRAAEEQVRLAMTAADRANKAKSEFLSRMSHELRTPLNAVLGFAQLLEIDALTTDQKESVSHILRGGRYLLNLINEVLDLARIEAGRLGLSLEPVPVREVVNAVATLIGPQAAEFGVRLAAPLPTFNAWANADRQRLQQVLLNLLSNGIKYNRRGGTVELGVTQDGDKLHIFVRDTGPGLSQAQIDRLFQPFERLDAARSGVEGTGLGLALSRTIVEAMEGRISVQSTVGVGSTFIVELDAADAADDQLDAFVHPQGADAAITVVYVEDNQANVRFVERVVSRRPRLRLVIVTDGDRALDTIRAERPALVLLDLNLPGLSGDVILQQLRQDPRTTELPVAILSADATPTQVARLRALGAQFYLTKPIDVGSLLEVLDSCAGQGAPGAKVQGSGVTEGLPSAG